MCSGIPVNWTPKTIAEVSGTQELFLGKEKVFLIEKDREGFTSVTWLHKGVVCLSKFH